MKASQRALQDENARPNMRFIVLDPNGEYSRAFSDMPERVRVFRPGDAGCPLVVPAWMWNSHEWAAVTQAQPGAQRPLLLQALRDLRAGRAHKEPLHVSIVRQARLFRNRTLAFLADGTGASYTDFLGILNCCQAYKNLNEVMSDFHARVPAGDLVGGHLQNLANKADSFVNAHKTWNQRRNDFNYTAPNAAEFNSFLPLFDAVEGALPKVPKDEEVCEDSPVPFDVRAIADHIDALSADTSASPNIASFVATLTLRIRSMIADRRLGPVVAPQGPTLFSDWLAGLLGSGGEGAQVAIVDLSLTPSEITHVVIAVLARIVFEASQRYQKQDPRGLALPTVLVLEEAHTFVRFGGSTATDEGNATTPARLCRETFERIAREGRKFGLGLVLSSQRPSELSATVLAQCNTFLLHRIVNDSDQDLVSKLVPDNVSGLLRELPSLPSRQAVLLGWATPLPVLVEIDELPLEHRPRSADPDFWNVWTRVSERPVDWRSLAEDWQASSASPADEGPEPAEPAPAGPPPAPPIADIDDDLPF